MYRLLFSSMQSFALLQSVSAPLTPYSIFSLISSYWQEYLHILQHQITSHAISLTILWPEYLAEISASSPYLSSTLSRLILSSADGKDAESAMSFHMNLRLFHFPYSIAFMTKCSAFSKFASKSQLRTRHTEQHYLSAFYIRNTSLPQTVQYMRM